MNLIGSLRPGTAHKSLIGMIHLPPLPGTPFFQPGSLQTTIENAVANAIALDKAGMDGCLLQTVDRIYPVADEADPARVSAMAMIAQSVRQSVRQDFQIGVQIMINANCASIAVAKLCGGTFIRASAFVGATLSAHGLVQAAPDRVMRYRRNLDALDVGVIAEIASMHFSWLGGDKSVGEVARLARTAGAEAVAISDPHEDRLLNMIDDVRSATPDMPLLLAGGSNFGNVSRILPRVDGAFVGTAIEAQGWGSQIDPVLAADYVTRVRKAG
jgi:uncharacterized protein